MRALQESQQSVSLAANITNTDRRIPAPVRYGAPLAGAPLAHPLATVTAVVCLQLWCRQRRFAHRALFDLRVWHPVVWLYCTLDKFWRQKLGH